MDRLQQKSVELDEQVWRKWIEKGELREQARKRRWRIIGGVVGGALLSVICLFEWVGRS